MRLKTQVLQLLENIRQMTDGGACKGFLALSKEVEALKRRLHEPLRVAVVGVMNAGKSTLMNAILKEKILFTANRETTYRVSWFKYGDTPRLQIVLTDGTCVDAPFEDLERWTVRDTGNDRIDDVEYTIVYYPNELLRVMEFIDTPGLFSAYERDARNTLDFLGLQEADRITSVEASKADAILYAFHLAAQSKDADVVGAFLGENAAGASPINAVGVFTKTDLYWNPLQAGGQTPLEIVEGAVHTYRQKLRDKLFSILPVVAKPVENAAAMDVQTYEDMRHIAGMPPDDLLDALADADYFAAQEDDMLPLTPAVRAGLLDRFGQYGIHAVAQAIRAGTAREDIVPLLYRDCGLEAVSRIIMQHFGKRVFLIKMNYIFHRVRSAALSVRQKERDAGTQKICDLIVQTIDATMGNEQVFAELRVLQSYYDGGFTLSPEDEAQFLALTGENGSDCAARLGAPPGADIRRLRDIALARAAHWNALANDLMAPPKASAAAEVIARTCEGLHYHLDMLAGLDD